MFLYWLVLHIQCWMETDSRYPWLLPSLRRNTFNIPPMDYEMCFSFSVHTFYLVKGVSSILRFMRALFKKIIETMLNFVRCICWIVSMIFSFNLLVYYISWFCRIKPLYLLKINLFLWYSILILWCHWFGSLLFI